MEGEKYVYRCDGWSGIVFNTQKLDPSLLIFFKKKKKTFFFFFFLNIKNTLSMSSKNSSVF